MTTLSSVNRVLRKVNLPSVNTVDPSPSPVVDTIVGLLNDTNAEYQGTGWWFNRDYRIKFTPDALLHIELSATAITAFESNDPQRTYVERFNRVYDLYKSTDEFTSDIQMNTTSLIPLDDTPAVWQDYVTAEAALMYHEQFRGRTASSETVRQARDRAWAKVRQRDTRSQRRHVSDSEFHRRTVLRNRGGPSSLDRF